MHYQSGGERMTTIARDVFLVAHVFTPSGPSTRSLCVMWTYGPGFPTHSVIYVKKVRIGPLAQFCVVVPCNV